jgi:hypothetical protein
MVQMLRPMEVACREFDALAELEPQLRRLWMLCQCASAPVAANDQAEDPYDLDLFDSDALTNEVPADSWCAELYFLQHIKPQLVALVGWGRVDGAPELRTGDAYDIAYSALFFHALNRSCVCCAAATQLLAQANA